MASVPELNVLSSSLTFEPSAVERALLHADDRGRVRDVREVAEPQVAESPAWLVLAGVADDVDFELLPHAASITMRAEPTARRTRDRRRSMCTVISVCRLNQSTNEYVSDEVNSGSRACSGLDVRNARYATATNAIATIVRTEQHGVRHIEQLEGRAACLLH